MLAMGFQDTFKALSDPTRREILELLRDGGFPVEERRVSVDELVAAARDGTLEEAWGCGTAAVVSPVGRVAYKGEEFIIHNEKIGSLTQALYDRLTGIQWGQLDDPFGWIHPVC